MRTAPEKISVDAWDRLRAELLGAGMVEPAYGGVLSRHIADGDHRLASLEFDNSPASLRLWNFLLSEEERLAEARAVGKVLVGTMKDLGTVPVMAYSAPNLVAFYPDGAWWIPCIMELSAGLLRIADRMGIDESFCPVRAMLGAFETKAHFPIPDLLMCSVGATCDDFSAIAQRLEAAGHPIQWWEMPHRRAPDAGEASVELPGGGMAPESQVAFVRSELERMRDALSETAGCAITDSMLREGIRAANGVRGTLEALRETVYASPLAPVPALEMLVAEMLAIHYCSDREETLEVLEGVLAEARERAEAGVGILPESAARVFWVNPVADMRAMNILEDCGGRLCGTDFLFTHALDLIPEDLEPMDALARIALADPMAGPSSQRAARICREMERFGAEALVISRIPGASHCSNEGQIIRDVVLSALALPVVEIEVPPVCDALEPALRTRLEALIEIVLVRRNR